MNLSKWLKEAQNQRGFSLAEVMVAAGMLGVISLGMMQLTKNTNQQQKKVVQDFSVNEVVFAMQNTLRDKGSCEATFEGVSVTAATPALTIRKRDKAGVVSTVFSPGQIVGQNSEGRMQITSIVLQSFANGTPGTATVRVTFTRQNAFAQATLGQQTVVRDIAVKISEGGNNLLNFGVVGNGDGCYADEDYYVDAACSSLGGLIDPVDAACKDISIQRLAATHAITSEDGIRVLTGNVDVQQGNVNVVNNGAASINVNSTTPGSLVQVQLGINAGANYRLAHDTSGNFQIYSSALAGAERILNVDNLGNTAIFNGQIQVRNKASGGTLTLPGNTAGRYDISASLDQAIRFVSPAGSGFSDLQMGSLTIGTGEVLMATNNLLMGSGGSMAGGANIELYSSGSGNTAYYDAAYHTFRTQTAATTTGDLMQIEGNLIINRSADEIGPIGTNTRRAVTKEWVNNILKGFMTAPNNLSGVEKEAIILWLLQSTTTTDTFAGIKADFLASLSVSAAASNPCPAGAYFTAVNYNTSTGAFSFTCTPDVDPVPDNCSVDGACANVFANSMLCVNRATAPTTNTCLSSGSFVFPENNDCAVEGWNQDVWGWRHARCSGVRAMKGLKMFYTGGNPNFHIECCTFRTIKL